MSKLRFAVDQAAIFRKGISHDKSTVTLDVDPASMSQEHRDLISDRLDGIDVIRLIRLANGEIHKANEFQEQGVTMVQAAGTDLADMIAAVERDSRKLRSAFATDEEYAEALKAFRDRL